MHPFSMENIQDSWGERKIGTGPSKNWTEWEMGDLEVKGSLVYPIPSLNLARLRLTNKYYPRQLAQ